MAGDPMGCERAILRSGDSLRRATGGEGRTPDGSSNKILWVTQTPTTDLTIVARPLGATNPTVTLEYPTTAGNQTPSSSTFPRRDAGPSNCTGEPFTRASASARPLGPSGWQCAKPLCQRLTAYAR